jgi:hypothetical protein
MKKASMIEPRCLIEAIRADPGFRPVSLPRKNGFVRRRGHTRRGGADDGRSSVVVVVIPDVADHRRILAKLPDRNAIWKRSHARPSFFDPVDSIIWRISQKIRVA